MPNVFTSCSSDYKTVITTRELQWIADEPESEGGTNEGPTPVEMLLGAISSCMAITMRLYANRKEWALEKVEVECELEWVKPEDCPSYEGDTDRKKIPVFTSKISLYGDLDEEQRTRIVEIGSRCPVHKIVDLGGHFVDEVAVD